MSKKTHLLTIAVHSDLSPAALRKMQWQGTLISARGKNDTRTMKSAFGKAPK